MLNDEEALIKTNKHLFAHASMQGSSFLDPPFLGQHLLPGGRPGPLWKDMGGIGKDMGRIGEG